MNTENLCHFFGKPDYSHIARDTAVRIQVTAEQMSAVLFAYDYGIDQLDEDSRCALDAVIANLKDALHP